MQIWYPFVPICTTSLEFVRTTTILPINDDLKCVSYSPYFAIFGYVIITFFLVCVISITSLMHFCSRNRMHNCTYTIAWYWISKYQVHSLWSLVANNLQVLITCKIQLHFRWVVLGSCQQIIIFYMYTHIQHLKY